MEAYTFFRPRANTRVLLTVALALVCALIWCRARGEDTTSDDALAKTVVEKADEVRFPKQGYEVVVDIETTSPDNPPESRTYRVLSKGNANTIVMALEPASDRGQALLLKGRDLWIFMPSVSQPVRLSLSQRLTGQVSNGDLARANFAGDYTAKVLRTEKLGADSTYVLELEAVDRGVTYHRVLYWVRQSDYRPQKAEFYSLSDRLLKSCLYQDYRQIAGRHRPGRLVMQDALRQGEESVLEYHDMRLRDLPDKMFTKDYLKHLD